MIDNDQVVFKIKISREAVRDAWNEMIRTNQEEEVYTELELTNLKLKLKALLCSEYVYVPESRLENYIKFGEVIEWNLGIYCLQIMKTH